MQISAITPSSTLSTTVAATAPTVPLPTTRAEAAQALAAIPGAIIMTATFGANVAETSRSAMLQPLLTKVTLEMASAVLEAAIQGAINVAPELAPQAVALRQSAAGVMALLTEAAADTKVGTGAEVSRSIIEPFAAVAAPLLAAAKLLKEAPAAN